jgi:hypothetical protein
MKGIGKFKKLMPFCGIITGMRFKKYFLLAGVILLMSPVKTIAQTPSSSNYSVPESSFSSGSDIDASSGSYSARVSAGDNVIGDAASTTYRAYAGPISPDEEYLEMVVGTASIDLGTLSDTSTAFGEASFYVRSYINSSYSIVTVSPTLTSENGDTIQALASTSSSSAGTEQFGINLVENSCPPAATGCVAPLGANPALVPDSNFANGDAATGYDVIDQYRYVPGETIASNSGNPAWGRTDYTISYITNISGITEAGLYTMVHVITAITTF